MAAWSLITEIAEEGEVSCTPMKCTDGENWEECTVEEYESTMLQILLGENTRDSLQEKLVNLIDEEEG